MTYGQIMDYIKNYKICSRKIEFEEIQYILEKFKEEKENNILNFKKRGDND